MVRAGTNLVDQADRLEAGRRVHEKEWPSMKEAARALHIAEYRVYDILREYRDSQGIVTEASRRARDSTAKRVAAKRAKAKERAKAMINGNGSTALAPIVAQATDKKRILDLEDQLAHAMEEVTTLQKLLMTVGRAL